MRKLLTWIGAATLVLLVVGGAGFAYMVTRGLHMDEEARLYADKAVRPIIEHWNPDALKAQASPSLLANIKPDQLASLFVWFQTLGELKTINPCTGQARLDVNTTTGRTLTGQYTCQAQFQAGPATIQLSLIKTQNQWRIFGFHVNSPALLPRPQSSKI
jgi:hypothetical protein